MTKPFVLLSALLLAGSAASAQAPAGPGPAAAVQKSPDQQAQRRAQYLAKELGLTADQQARLTPILQGQRQDMLALRDKVQANGRQRGLGQELKAAQANYTDQIRAVLTPEQFARFEQLKDEQLDKLHERRGGGQGPRQ